MKAVLLLFCCLIISFTLKEERKRESVCVKESSLSCVKARGCQTGFILFLSQYKGYPTLTAGFPWHVRARNPCQCQFTPPWQYLLPAVPGQVPVPACIPSLHCIKFWDLSKSLSVFRSSTTLEPQCEVSVHKKVFVGGFLFFFTSCQSQPGSSFTWNCQCVSCLKKQGG